MDDGPLEPTLEELVNSHTLKWIFVGGKGGVGKTTTSCALAVKLAEIRKDEKILIISTDPAHNIADAFSQTFSTTPTQVDGMPNLYAMEIRQSAEVTSSIEDDELGIGSFVSELLSTFPGIDEALSFAELMNAVRSMDFDVIIFDTAPTGHTLRLIGFPTLIEKGLDKLATLREKMAGTLSMFQSISGGQIDEEKLNEKLDSLRALTSSVRATFEDPAKTTFVCVCIPEFLSIYETERLVQALVKHKMDCSNIVVNQVLFPVEEADALGEIQSDKYSWQTLNSTDPFAIEMAREIEKAAKKYRLLNESFLARRRMQSKYLKSIDDLYSFDFHVIPIGIQPQEVRGLALLKKFGDLLMTPRKLPIIAH